jgi:uncharacterized membrane protein YhhN
MSYLLLLIILSGLLHIAGLYVKSPSLKMVFKPITTAVIIYFAFLQGGSSFPFYKIMILIGLGLSLVGDIFLMLPRERFVAGLVAFLTAHLVFISAFVFDFPLHYNWMYLAPVALYLLILLKMLMPHTGKMTLPVVVYALVIGTFLWLAGCRYGTQPAEGTFYALSGALLFVLSDSLLAFNKFVKTLKWAPGVLMVLYWAALYFLALSI